MAFTRLAILQTVHWGNFIRHPTGKFLRTKATNMRNDRRCPRSKPHPQGNARCGSSLPSHDGPDPANKRSPEPR